MKLKCVPEDFEVEELAKITLADGPFAVYRMTKRGLGTPEAISAIQRRWKLTRRQISYGGLKDKHAVTRQWVTIHRGPRRDLQQDHLSLEYQGQTSESFGPQGIDGNRFRIVIRDLTEPAARTLLERARRLSGEGVPNYFDDQRFGSLGVSGEFIARSWCRGDYERALWLAIAEINPHDRPHDKDEKRILQKHWKQWGPCKAALPKSSRRSIVTYLVDHPEDFRRAFALLPVVMRSLYLAAFQSDLWNRCLAAWLKQELSPDDLWDVELGTGKFPFPRRWPDSQNSESELPKLPLPSARLHLDEGPLLSIYERVLAEQGLSLRELRVKYPRDSFFSKGEREPLLKVSAQASAMGDDEHYPGRQKVSLQFSLPRGAYATIVIKKLTTEAGETSVVADESADAAGTTART
ncbi:MAG: tRNA pseudouridine(13) synthase TruD [Planctomycetaceae bacterium]